MDRGGWIGGWAAGRFERSEIRRELPPAEAGVTLTALRVEDPERRPSPRRAVAVSGDQRLRALAHDVATEADPRAPSELQAESGGLGHGGGQAATGTERLEDDEDRVRAPGEGREATEPVGEAGRAVRGGEAAAGQIQDEQVHRAAGEQRATDGQPLVEGGRGDDDEPLEADAAGDGLHRVE